RAGADRRRRPALAHRQRLPRPDRLLLGSGRAHLRHLDRGATRADGLRARGPFPGVRPLGRLPVTEGGQRKPDPASFGVEDALGALRPQPGTRLFGRLLVSGGDLVVAPISVLDEAGVRSLALAEPSVMAVPAAAPEDSDGDEPDEDAELDEGPLLVADEPVGRALSQARGELESIAAAGAGARHVLDGLAAIRELLSALG